MIERIVGYALIAAVCGAFMGLINSLTFRAAWVGIACVAVVVPGLFLSVCYFIYLIINGVRNG